MCTYIRYMNKQMGGVNFMMGEMGLLCCEEHGNTGTELRLFDRILGNSMPRCVWGEKTLSARYEEHRHRKEITQ